MKSAQPSEMTEERLEIIAAANAVSCWFDGEGKLAQQIQQRPFSDAGQFRKWLSLWGLARRVKRDPPSCTSRLQEFLDLTARPIFLAAATQTKKPSSTSPL